MRSALTRLSPIAAVLMLCGSAAAEPESGSDLETTHSLPPDIQADGDGNPGGLFLTGGGFVTPGGATAPKSVDNNGEAVYRLANARYGMTVSEPLEDFSLGDWCTALPIDAGESIDWAATASNVLASAACRTEGRILYNPSAESDFERILFTRGGKAPVSWVVNAADGTKETRNRTYMVSWTTPGRPYRLFWTEDSFGGPPIRLTFGNGQEFKHVRLFGDPSIVVPRYEVDAASGTSNIVHGVVVDSNSHMIRAYARHDADIYRNEHVGPRGQFVAAYYATDTFEKLVCTIVVEVDQPGVTVFDACVGDRLRPDGAGYSTDFISASIHAGDQKIDGDANAPYLYKHAGATDFSPKSGWVYAIAPNDAAHQDLGEDAPDKADIYWESTDPMGTLWPFEHDQYVIRWGDDLPKVVTGGAAAPGCGILLPSAYENLTSVEHYSSPANIAKAAANAVSVTGAGKFLLKISADDNVWFLPLESLLNTDGLHYEREADDWHVGMELRPRGDAAAGAGAALADEVDPSLPGYIYEAGSVARNWNPRLYHEPRLPTAAEEASPPSGGPDDPYDALESAIYAVRAAADPIEVWWFRELKADDMPSAIRFPTSAQLYRAVWPLPEETHSIVLASQLGSAGESLAASSQAIYLADAASRAVANVSALGGPQTGATVGFWVNPSPRAGGFEPVAAGRVLTLSNEAASVAVEAASAISLSVAGEAVAVNSNEWTHIALAFAPDAEGDGAKLSVYRNGALSATAEVASAAFLTNATEIALGASGAAPCATAVAIDHLAVWPFVLPADDLATLVAGGSTDSGSRMRHSWTFDNAGDIEHIRGLGLRYAFDGAGGLQLAATNCLALGPGGPAPSSGLVAMNGGVAPRLYFQNDAGAVGYNPNEEHAFLREAAGGFVAYALRCDLNLPDSSDPFVLVEWNDGGRGAMRAFDVSLTNEVYSTLESDVTAGNLLAGPHPLDYLDGYYNTRNYCIEASTNADAQVVYRDRLHRMWARRDGTTRQYNFYPVQEGFWFPSLPAARQPAFGELVGWMSCAASTNAPEEKVVLKAEPLPWTWHAAWPADDKVPTMRVGETLSKADQGLPEVWNASSMAVVYPVPKDDAANTNAAGTVATLIDPTVAQSAPLAIDRDFPSEYGFTVGPAGTCQLKGGKYHFTGLPPNVSDRFYIDTSAGEAKRMNLVGRMVERSAGADYLQVNTLSDDERAALKAICTTKNAEAKARWNAGVDALATAQVEPSRRSVKPETFEIATPEGETGHKTTSRVAVDYKPKDHYALVATGCGTNYVTLVENDSADEAMVASGSPVSMHVLRVVPELYAGALVVLQDPNNKLSEQLNVLYTAPMGDRAGNFEFEWRRREPSADGRVPETGEDWTLKLRKAGATSLLLGASGANLTELVNTYYEMRYRARPGTAAYDVTGDAWSAWCGPTLAEGWVQRVLDNVTPFAQRLDDFYEHAAEIAYTMPEQIGGPYHGDVALNNDNLESVGLVELYQTVLNKAESLSLSLGINDLNANKQLLEAVSRLADLYTLLGDDAYADAANPTIEASSVQGWTHDYGAFPGSTYCFANQVPSLLDEELALLRGRTAAVAPNMTTYPCYNRLMWNFTKGVTQGEMAYVQNYGINGAGGEITVEQAAAQYPMGHGDAWGHYLSAVWGYYRLLRNPYFDWGEPGMIEMLVADSVVNMDYEDEQKMASAAAKMAQAGARVADLTARKTWRDQEGDTQAGYFDANAEQGFGYGEWAVRTGLGALWNWATVNSLLPTNETASLFADRSIADVTRVTVPALDSLAGSFAAVDSLVNRLDAGLNPMGLSESAVPFDIDPVLVASGEASHFEQILARAERALENAGTVLDYAGRSGARLRQIAASVVDDSSAIEQSEEAFNRELVAIYGTPYPDDIGPSGTYPQGYDGPDYYHYNYVDLAPYGLSSLASGMTTSVVVKVADVASLTNYAAAYAAPSDGKTITVAYNVSSGGILVKPGEWTGVRLSEGTIQAAYRDFLAAYVDARQKIELYGSKVSRLNFVTQTIPTQWADAQTRVDWMRSLDKLKISMEAVKLVSETTLAVKESLSHTAEFMEGQNKSIPWIVAGLAGGSNIGQAIANATMGSIALTMKTGADAVSGVAKVAKAVSEGVVDITESAMDITFAKFDAFDTKVALQEKLLDAVAGVRDAAFAIQESYAALAAAEAAYRAEVDRGDRIRQEREMVRRQQSNVAVARRYQDMFYRVQRNAALSKFDTAFDVAQRYVWQLAKVYDYETGLLSSDPLAGDAFLREIVATRALGEKGVAIVADGTDGGLWDVVSRMKGNWEVLKGRLGVNNPEAATKWFSLRYSLFRIDPGAKGDEAWRRELAKYAVRDVFADAEVARYCQPPQGSGASVAEPGFVIPFASAVNLAENFFGRPLLGGETTFSSSDYAVKINAVGVDFAGYDALAVADPAGLAREPNIYLVPVGADLMRTPAGTRRETLAFRVIDQVLPLPYAVGSTQLDDPDWLATFSGLDGSVDSAATIRRHSTLAVGPATSSTRLVGRSVWNDRWLLVIPASSLSSDRAAALKTFVNGLDTDRDGQIDVPGVSDILVGVKAYSRSGN